MQLISDEYKVLNQNLHSDNRFYGAIGFRHMVDILKLAAQYDTMDILDYGCGKSSLARNMPFNIHEYDPAVAKHAAMPLPSDIVVCTDVLEHIEPLRLDDVLFHLKSLTQKAGFFTACTTKAHKFLPDGRNAHLIVENKAWWETKIKQYFKIISLTEEKNEIIFVVAPL
jgi:2-polyprenyl-3-methyl-5-hydroxy-6-metoxy-1,4-benzoquinol methylase